MDVITYSILIPLKDEEGNIGPLIHEIDPVMHALGKPWELICIDDGSTDTTEKILRELAVDRPHLRIVTFDKNYGQSSAFAAGFSLAKGTFTITLDGDRQNDPADIPKLLEALQNCDMVCGVRERRRDTWWRRTISHMGNSVRRWVCKDTIQDNNCSLKAYRTSCLKQIKMYEGMHRFLPALFLMEGFTVEEVGVKHRERSQGKSKYNLRNRGVNTIFDLLAIYWMRRRALRYRYREN